MSQPASEKANDVKKDMLLYMNAFIKNTINQIELFSSLEISTIIRKGKIRIKIERMIDVLKYNTERIKGK